MKLLLGLLIIAGGVAQMACTMEAKVCPDGSSVGRSGPNCEFDPCPGSSDRSLPGFYGGGGFPSQCRSDSDCGPGMCCTGGSWLGRRLLADDASSSTFSYASASSGYLPSTNYFPGYPGSSLYPGLGGLRRCQPMAQEGQSCDLTGLSSCGCAPGLECTYSFGYPYGSTCKRSGGSGGVCWQHSDCPSGCCHRTGLFGTGTCGALAQAGEACSTSSFGSNCPCASGLTCTTSGYFGGFGGFGDGTCSTSGGSGGFCWSHSQCGADQFCRRSGTCGPSSLCQPFDSVDFTCPSGGGSGSCGYCPPGTSCQLNQVQCFAYPCPPQWQCMPTSGGGTVSDCSQCPPNTRCQSSGIVCIRWPCPQQYTCVPFGGGGHQCGVGEEWTDCASSSCFEDKCFEPKPDFCTADCRQGCRCRPGYSRNFNGECTTRCSPIVIGRPFSSSKGDLLSPVMLAPPTINISEPEPVGLLPGEDRAVAASYWAHIAMMEHASIASFSRFSMQLMSVGAPLALLQATHQAAQDEIRHTQVAVALANKFGGTNVALGDFPVTSKHMEFGNITAIAEATTLEGCVEETLSALVVQEGADLVVDPVVRQALRGVASDEATHAALAWRSVKWMLEKAPELRPLLSRVIAASKPEPQQLQVSTLRSPLEDVGILAHPKILKLREVAWSGIVAPAANALGLLHSCEPAAGESTRPIRELILHALVE